MRASILLVIVGACLASVWAGEAVPFRVHGQQWTDIGRIVQASDTLLPDGSDVNVNGASMHSLGAQFTVDADLGEHWSAGIGIGAYQVSHALGNGGQPNFLNVSLFNSYIPEAKLTYFQGTRDNPWLSLTIGNFAYDYNPDVKNLGLYLLRGPVYPGLLVSGFGDFNTDTTKSTQTGLHLHHAWDNFSQDLLFINERAIPPMFDWSLAYVAKYRAFNALEIGGGVNFYRLVPYSKPLEVPGRMGDNTDAAKSYTISYADTAGGHSPDTTFYTHQGVKLMAMFSLDPKRWLSFKHMGESDFKLYGEVAVLGVKDYGTYYNDITQRIPMMVGFNVPTFGVLDLFSVEVEWYGSPYRDDLGNLGNPASIVAPWMNQFPPIPSPTPVQLGGYADSTADNWKWSVLLQKNIAKHIRFTAQIANDHYRPAPLAINIIYTTGGAASALTAPSDWYFMCRLGFFF